MLTIKKGIETYNSVEIVKNVHTDRNISFDLKNLI